jgi:hypothetical protein
VQRARWTDVDEQRDLGTRLDDDRLDETVRGWLDREGYSSKKATDDDDAVWHYIVKYPAGKGDANIHVVRPENRPLLALVMGVQLSPKHKKPYSNLDDEDKRRLTHRLRRTAFQEGHVGFAGHVDEGMLTRWQLDSQLYDDAVGQDRFFRELRRIYTKHLLLIEVLNEQLGGVGGGPTSTGDDIRGYI